MCTTIRKTFLRSPRPFFYIVKIPCLNVSALSLLFPSQIDCGELRGPFYSPGTFVLTVLPCRLCMQKVSLDAIPFPIL